ncbi:DoxX family protein [Enterobacter chuandaensis]|uniref:DoxX family protein n=1 Tax=Enterobacter chuandaensis TaxID=2497875 RepID=UPI002075EF78|nr:DoxX family protein [Enterobacter chuandaensis]MCM7589608.1 DoxX family protein [Enterobacter chuandaensis]
MNMLLYFFVLIFTIGTIVNFAGPKKVKEAYSELGLPGWFRFITGTMELISLILIFTGLAAVGYIIAALVMVGAVLLMMRTRLYKEIAAPGLTLIIIFLLLSNSL